MTLDTVATPALVVDRGRLERNARRLVERLPPGLKLRPHFKTAKSIEVAQIALAGRTPALTVSTLKEAEFAFDGGVHDITYAVGVAPDKLPRVANLVRRGCRLQLVVDDPSVAAEVGRCGVELGVVFRVLVELDVDGHRAGVLPESPALIDTAQALEASPGAEMVGVLTHAGESYHKRGDAELERAAESERAGAVAAAETLRAAGLPCHEVSVGSSPTALRLKSWEGLTEVRAGVYLFWDLFQSNLGVCGLDQIALTVVATVIGRRPERGWLILDAGGHALSKDRGTVGQAIDYRFGQVCDLHGEPLPGWRVTAANQEHGIVESFGDPIEFHHYPVGTRLRILPNHACATAACHDHYEVVDGGQQVLARWRRINGW
jgi:D-serine deaminase-like pyridoxal phosphate-dependent protein